mgnify:CR=1 FL=1
MIKITVVQTTTASTDDGLDPERVGDTIDLLNVSTDFSLEDEIDDTPVTSFLSLPDESAEPFIMCIPCEIEV